MPEDSTTPDPVELTHRAYGFLNRRDLDAVVALLSPTCVYDLSRWELGVYAGAEAIRAFADDWLGKLHEYGVAVGEIEHFGDGVVYIAQVGHRARAPGGFIELPSSVVAIWEGGLLAHVTVYADRDEARAAAERLAQERG
jgi:ketosteroid isomerase-like protein